MSAFEDRFTVPKAAVTRKNGRIELGMPSRPTRAQLRPYWEEMRRQHDDREQQRTVQRPSSARHAPLHSYMQGVAQQAEARELMQTRAVNRCQGRLHSRTSEGNPLIHPRTQVQQDTPKESERCCTLRYQGKLQLEAKVHEADRIADEAQHKYRIHQCEVVRRAQDSLAASSDLAAQYPHGLPRGMIRRINGTQNMFEPCPLGFGQ